MFGALYAPADSPIAALTDVAREFSPRIAVERAADGAPRDVTLDLSGLTRLFGDAATIARELRRTAADRGLRVRVAIADTRTAARLLAHARPGLTIVETGDEADAVGELPIDLLEVVIGTANRGPGSGIGDPGVRSSSAPGPRPPDPVSFGLRTLKRWGLRTLGQFAALPTGDVAARLGQEGVAWQRLARGQDPSPLVPALPEERFEQALDLEWPIEGLEPLSFVLARLMEPLSAHLERRDRGAAVLHVRLHLVKADGVTREVHERSLQLPTPIRDARALRTLALLDLESHPPAAAIDRVVVAVDPTPGRVLQFSLLTRPLPAPEQISTLLARLTALMGEGRCGSPAVVDSWAPGAFEMKPFAPETGDPGSGVRDPENAEPLRRESRQPAAGPWSPDPGSRIPDTVSIALRRFRVPIPARVHVEGGAPLRVLTDRRGMAGGRVEICAGPWRTSGAWWIEPPAASQPRPSSAPHWDRDEWDVTLADGATYRVFRDRERDAWFVEGVVD